jgi:hypothetical protein
MTLLICTIGIAMVVIGTLFSIGVATVLEQL